MTYSLIKKCPLCREVESYIIINKSINLINTIDNNCCICFDEFDNNICQCPNCKNIFHTECIESIISNTNNYPNTSLSSLCDILHIIFYCLCEVLHIICICFFVYLFMIIIFYIIINLHLLY
jgi:hypothetical protein